MAITHISLAFVQDSDADLESLVDKVLGKMAGNVNFTTPSPALTVITTAFTTFKAAVVAMNQSGTAATIARDNARAALIALLRSLILYIEQTAGGDPIKLDSTGFDTVTSGSSAVVLVKPAINGIDFGSPGSVVLHCGAMGGATFLNTQFRTGGGAWQNGPTSTSARSVIIPNLVSGTTYDFRVQFGAGGGNVSDWSDPVSHMAG